MSKKIKYHELKEIVLKAVKNHLKKMKNESVKQILEFIGLRSKLYSYTAEGDDHKHNNHQH